MSGHSERFSLGEFSAFFNNEQSDGHRLAEFLQKKKGVTTRKRRVLADYEPGPINLNVQVEKADINTETEVQPIPAQQQNDKKDDTATNTKYVEINDENAPKKQGDDAQNLSSSTQKADGPTHTQPQQQSNAEQNAEQNEKLVYLPTSPKPRQSLSRFSTRSGGAPASPSDRLRRYSLKRLSVGRRTLLREFDSTVSPSNFLPSVCSTPCHSTSRYQPPSTLIHNVLPLVSENTAATSATTTTAASNTTVADSPELSTMQNLQLKDDELKEMLKAVHDTTQKLYRERSPSPARRSFNVQRGPKAGQIILTPTKDMEELLEDDDGTGITKAEQPQNTTKILPRKDSFRSPAVSTKSANTSAVNVTVVPNTPERRVTFSANVSRQQPDVYIPETQEECQQMLNATPPNDQVRMVVCVSVPRESVTNHETNDRTTGSCGALLPATPKSTRVQTPVRTPTTTGSCGAQLSTTPTSSRRQTPVHQGTSKRDINCSPVSSRGNNVVGTTPPPSRVAATPLRAVAAPGSMRTPVRSTASPRYVSPYTFHPIEPAVPVEQPSPVRTRPTLTQVQILNEVNAVDGRNYQEDIMTDDDSEVETKAAQQQRANAINAPLNLASSSSTSTTRTRKRRKRSMVARRSTHQKKSPLASTETETEMGPPRAHPVIVSRMQHQSQNGHHKRRVLNKAPNTPINGEKFAAELARLTNHEILDLRKRNSLGRVFPISGRKSQTAKKEALEKRNQLEEKIQIEIRKRHIDDDDDNTDEETQCHETVQETQVRPARTMTPISKFVQSIIQRDRDLSPLYGVGSEDRVTFGGAGNQTQSGGTLNGTKKLRQRRRINGPAPEVQDYLALRKEVRSRSKAHMDQSTKRSLYTKGQSDLENSQTTSPEHNRSPPRTARQTKTFQFPIVPSPPSPMPPQPALKIVSPPPRKSKHSTKPIATPPSPPTSLPPSPPTLSPPSPLTLSPPFEYIGATVVIPPPELFTNRDSTARANTTKQNVTNTTKAKEIEFIETEQMETEQTVHTSQVNPRKHKLNQEAPALDNEVYGGDTQSETESERIEFKKPSSRAPKSKKQKISMDSIAPSEQSLASGADSSSLRRSRRGHVPLKNTWSFRNRDDPTPLFQLKYQEVVKRNLQKAYERQEAKKSQSTVEITIPLASSTVNTVQKKKGRPRKNAAAPKKPAAYTNNSPVEPNPLEVIAEIPSDIEDIEIPPVDDHHNDMFDRLKNGDIPDDHQPTQQSSNNTRLSPSHSKATSASAKVRKVRVCLKRTPATNAKGNKEASREQRGHNEATTSRHTHNMSVQTETTTSNSSVSTRTGESHEFLTWLKGEQDMQETTGAEKTFKEMQCCAANTIAFNDLEGIDYAFYDTDDKASLGYLRFQPHQIKPSKRTSKYNLHFVVISGSFEIVANGESGIFPPGDMIVIKNGSMYKIQNISNEVGVLMVIKK